MIVSECYTLILSYSERSVYEDLNNVLDHRGGMNKKWKT